MTHAFSWIVFTAALIGNCGFWLFCFNRINSTGLPRKTTKRIEKLFIAACFAIPSLVLFCEHRELATWLLEAASVLPQGTFTRIWVAASLTSLAILGPIWLESRIWIWPPKNLLDQSGQQFHVAKEIEGGSTGTATTRLLERLPGNQITHIDVTSKHLQLPRAIPAASGLRIGHLSDLHFTGQLTKSHYRFVLDRFQELQPDLIAITGDIIDYEHCLPWFDELLGPLSAPLGKLFILGNHDCRIRNIQRVVDGLTSLGFTDAGVEVIKLPTPTGLTIEIHGNERPWLDRKSPASTQHKPTASEPDDQTLRLGLSHAPDQIRWAQELGLDLLLAGHTHGGQVRIPGIGPIVAPSRYGSRYASGLFLREPTLMHVSRGVAGTHPLRLRCLPEVSVLSLK